MKRDDKFGLVRILELIKSGLSPSNISKQYSIPKQNISYYVCKLKKLGCIEKKGYGVWKYLRPISKSKTLPKDTKASNSFTSIRGHAFIWKIQFNNPYNWNKILKYYKKKLTFQLMHNKVYRTIYNNRKVWLNKKGLTIYESLDFMGRSSFEVKGNAVFQMDLLIKGLINELGLKFQPYRFTTSREHYGLIKNELARQYNDKKEKMQIRSEDGTIWMWIDDSKSLGELENAEPIVSRQVQNYWNDHKKHKFQVTPSYVLNMMHGIQKNQLMFAENMKSHLKVLDRIGEGIEELTKKVKEMKK